MSHVAYPSTLPKDCVLRAIEILRAGQVADRGAELAEDIWNVQGYVQNLLIGPAPDHTKFGASEAVAKKAHNAELQKAKESADLRELAAACQDAVGEVQKGEFGMSSAAAPTAERPWLELLIKNLPMLLQLLIQLGVFKTAGTPKQ